MTPLTEAQLVVTGIALAAVEEGRLLHVLRSWKTPDRGGARVRADRLWYVRESNGFCHNTATPCGECWRMALGREA